MSTQHTLPTCNKCHARASVEPGRAAIVLCPLHRSNQALLEALEATQYVLRTQLDRRFSSDNDFRTEARRAEAHAHTTIKRAKGE